MTAVLTSITIAAPCAVVWAVLTDFDAMPTWNPFLRNIEGELAPGARLSVMSMPPGQAPRKFEPEIIAVVAPTLLTWRGGHGLPGVFDSEALFRLEAFDERHTKLTQSERYYGLLTPLLMRGKRKQALLAGYLAMNTALKLKAEAEASAVEQGQSAVEI